jgi:hypothetical protein
MRTEKEGRLLSENCCHHLWTALLCAGLREVMDLVAVRLQAGETEEAFNVLSRVLRCSEWKYVSKGNASAVKQAMQLVCLLSAALDKEPSPAGGKEGIERFATGVMDCFNGCGLPDTDVAKGLAAAAGALSSEAFSESLVALLSASALTPNGMEPCLAAVAAARPPALQQRLMAAVMASVLPGGKLSASLQRDACAALASALCGGSPYLPAPLVDPLLGPFAAALLAHEGCPSILREVLQREAVQKVAYDECIAALVRRRIKQVESWTAHGPPDSWEQPGAWLPELPDIQAFLRGPEMELQVGQPSSHTSFFDCPMLVGGEANNVCLHPMLPAVCVSGLEGQRCMAEEPCCSVQ